MKPSILIASIILAATSFSAAAATDRSYYITELVAQQKFDVYNDGRNTYLESIPGLVVTGATADGERYIVNGVPHRISGFMNGKPITVVRGTPPSPKAAAPDPTVVNAQIKQLTEKLDALTSKVQPKTAPALTSVAGATTETAAVATTATPGLGQSSTTRAHITQRRDPTIKDLFTYRVSPSDQNLRLLLERWSKMVGWKAIWDVDRDILIDTAGEKVGDFKTSVRWLLASTEFGDLVAKPCFYNNSVVRVVRKTVKCNPNE